MTLYYITIQVSTAKCHSLTSPLKEAEGGGRGSFESGLRKYLCMPMVENARSRPMDAKEKEGLGAGPPSKRAEL